MSDTPERLKTYRCAECGGEFEYGWSDEEAHAEAEKSFGKRGDAAGMAIVCDDCYRMIMASFNS